MRVPRRIPFYTNRVTRHPPKIPMTPPLTMGRAIEFTAMDSETNTPIKCTFYDMKAKVSHPISVEELSHLPTLKGHGTNVVEDKATESMKQLRAKDASKWTITRLSKEFQVPRSLIINRVLSLAERQRASEELEETIDRMSVAEKRGFILKHVIRHARRQVL